MPAPARTTARLVLLFLAITGLVIGLGTIVRGAEISVFMPAAFLAAGLGWGLGRTCLRAWPGLAGLLLLGGILLWGWTAQSGSGALLFLISIGLFQFKNFLFLHGYHPLLFTGSAADAQSALLGLLAQSAALLARLEAWLTGLRAGVDVNDPVVRVLVWSMLLWVLAAWAGWSVARGRVLTGLLPGLVILAAVTRYTNAQINALWLMTCSLLALMSLARFDANLRHWLNDGLDYAELIISNTLLTALLLVMTLSILGWMLPRLSVKDFLESFRHQDVSENQAARSLGLEAVQQQTNRPPSTQVLIRPPGLPNGHLLGSGPELSQDVVFTVSTGELPPVLITHEQTAVPRHYWRSFNFDVYTGSGWVSSSVESVQIQAGRPIYDSAPSGYSLLKQSLVLKHAGSGSLFWSGVLNSSSASFVAAWRTPVGQSYPEAVDPLRGADLFGATQDTSVYQVESYILQVSNEQLNAAGRETPDFIQQRYTRLPVGVPERVYALARDLTSTSPTPYAEARAIETFLRKNYPYSLQVGLPPAGRDVADYFLFDLKKGYCDYYATAMVVLARSVGLPARLVTGYASGTYNSRLAEYTVSAADAHAWVEIYFSGLGWVEFEPTAAQPEFSHPARLIGSSNPALVNPQTWDLVLRSYYRMPPISRGVLIGIGFLLLLPGVIFVLEGWLLGLMPPVSAMKWIYRSVYRQASHLIGASMPGQTASEFAERLQIHLNQPDPHLGLLTDKYLQALFSPVALQKKDVRQALRAWRALCWKLVWIRKTKSTSGLQTPRGEFFGKGGDGE